MTPDDMKAAHRALLQAVFCESDPRAIEPWLAASHSLHQSVLESLPPGRGGAVWAVEQFRTSFGKAYFQIQSQIAGEDRCHTRLVAQVQHTGRLAAARPTGRWLRLEAMVISRFAAGKAVETWVESSDFDLLRRLRAVEVREPAASAATAKEA